MSGTGLILDILFERVHGDLDFTFKFTFLDFCFTLCTFLQGLIKKLKLHSLRFEGKKKNDGFYHDMKVILKLIQDRCLGFIHQDWYRLNIPCQCDSQRITCKIQGIRFYYYWINRK